MYVIIIEGVQLHLVPSYHAPALRPLLIILKIIIQTLLKLRNILN